MTSRSPLARPVVLVVDDDANITALLRRALTLEGYDVETSSNGPDANREIDRLSPDLVILDIMLPGYDGVEVLRRVRASKGDRNMVPVLLLTARDEVADRVRGLDTGADDYLVKPFAIEELTARLRALRRRREPDNERTLRFADLSVDTASREVRRGTRDVQLTTKEYALLEYMMRNKDRILSRSMIMQHVWKHDFDPESNIIDVYIKRVRQKIERPGQSQLIHSIRGVGYRMRESG
ncbi:MAG: DNA-binding response regulator, partial [Chloroflexi bacterium]|nr:DNA-binding response regulator [Chloroflexota bacterium]